MMVYFIQSGHEGPIKIGISSNPDARLKQMQVGNPFPLRLLYASDGSKTIEETFHAMFHEDKMTGEWFYPTAKLLRHIQQLRKEQGDYTPEKSRKSLYQCSVLKDKDDRCHRSGYASDTDEFAYCWQHSRDGWSENKDRTPKGESISVAPYERQSYEYSEKGMQKSKESTERLHAKWRELGLLKPYA